MPLARHARGQNRGTHMSYCLPGWIMISGEAKPPIALEEKEFVSRCKHPWGLATSTTTSPRDTLILTYGCPGHSLGGVVGSLLGLTYGLPVMTFEAYPDAMAASRLGLPTPPGYRIGAHQSRPSTGIHHYGHTADPIFMGTCNAATSLCTIAPATPCKANATQAAPASTTPSATSAGAPASAPHRIVNVIKDVIEKYDTVPLLRGRLRVPGLLQLEVFRKQQQRNHHQLQQALEHDLPNSHRDLQNPRLVGLLGRDDHAPYSHDDNDQHPHDLVLQDSGLVWLQRPHDHDPDDDHHIPYCRAGSDRHYDIQHAGDDHFDKPRVSLKFGGQLDEHVQDAGVVWVQGSYFDGFFEHGQLYCGGGHV
ncbi:hypothetical protein L1887_54419 [Cichorium endivia]|nr:hypothetical protein L1887_54419 [Cichorium endivia]